MTYLSFINIKLRAVDGVVEAKVFRAPIIESLQGYPQLGSVRIVIRGVNNTTFSDDSQVIALIKEILNKEGLLARQMIVEGVKLHPFQARIEYKQNTSSFLTDDEIINKIHGYLVSLPIGVRYKISELYRLFDNNTDIELVSICKDDEQLAEDAVYDFSADDSITINGE